MTPGGAWCVQQRAQVNFYVPKSKIEVGDVVTITSSRARGQVLRVSTDSDPNFVLGLVSTTAFSNGTLTVTLSGETVNITDSETMVRYKGCSAKACKGEEVWSHNPNDIEDTCTGYVVLYLDACVDVTQ